MGEIFNDYCIVYLYEVVCSGSVCVVVDVFDIVFLVVSCQISLLEQELVVLLIECYKCGVSLIEVGVLLLEYYCEQCLYQFDVLVKLQEICGFKCGLINIIMGEGFILDMVSGFIKQFCKKYLEILLVLDLVGINEVVSVVVVDEVEIGLVFNLLVEVKIVSCVVVCQFMYVIVGWQFFLLGKVELVMLCELVVYLMVFMYLVYGMW